MNELSLTHEDEMESADIAKVLSDQNKNAGTGITGKSSSIGF